MQTKLVKVTMVLKLEEDVTGEFVLQVVTESLVKGEDVVGFRTEDTTLTQLEQEGFGDCIFDN